MRKMSIVLAVITAMVLTAGAALAGGPHDKATGTVTWTARGGELPGLESSFDVHDDAPGTESDRGTYWTSRPADDNFGGGTLTLTVECVNVDGNEAWFAGNVASATGDYLDDVGDTFLYWVKDNSTPGSEAPDQLGGTGRYTSIETACPVVDEGGWTGSGAVTDGNLKVFSSEDA